MANAKVCDNCGKVIDGIHISIKGYKVEKIEYGIDGIEDFCSFNCLSEYAKKQQEILEDVLKLKNKKEGE